MTRQLWGKEDLVKLVAAYDRLIWLLIGSVEKPTAQEKRKAWQDIELILEDLGYHDE